MGRDGQAVSGRTSKQARLADGAVSVGSRRRGLAGRWTVAAFLTVARRIEQSRTASYLLVSDGRSEKCFFFPVGAVRAASVGRRRGHELQQALERHPGLDAKAVRALIASYDSDAGSGPWRRLSDLPAQANQILHECSRAIVRDELLDLLVWEGAQYEFREGNPPPKIFDPRVKAVKLSTGVALLLQEAQKKAVRWKELAPRFGHLPRARVLPGNPLQRALATPTNDTACRSADAILEAVGEEGARFDDVVLAGRRVGVDAIEVVETIVCLAEQGVVRIQPGSAGSGRGEKRDREAIEQEIAEIECALEFMIDALVARLRLADCYEAIGEKNKAAQQLRIAGEQLQQRGRSDEALGVLRRVLAIKPHDFGVREKIVSILHGMRRFGEAVREGLELANHYQRYRLFHRAAGVLKRLVGWAPRDVELRRRLIDLLVRTDRTREAVAEYARLAELYAELEDEEAALACYQQMLALEPTHRDARSRIERFARRSKAFVAPYVGVAAGYLLLFVGGFFLFERYREVRAFRLARAEAIRLAEGNDFNGARRVLSEVAVRYDVPRDKLRTVRSEVDRLERYFHEAKAYELVRRARKFEENNDARAARQLYARVLSRYGESRFAPTARQRLAVLERNEDEARRLAHQASLLRRDHKSAEEFERVRELVRRYPATEVAHTIELPIALYSEPSGALLYVDGRSVNARTPFELRRPAARALEVRLVLDGFEPWRARLDPRDPKLSYPLRVQLQRRARWRSLALGPVVAAPWVDDETIVVGGTDQRLRVYDRRGVLRWSRSVGFGAEVFTQPVRTGDVVTVATRDGAISAWSLADGALRWRERRPEPVTELQPVDDGGVVLAAGRTVERLTADGTSRWRSQLDARVLAGPVRSGGTLAVALADG
ncbi:MAG: PEGA domain-containing protein, partial [Planctomycetota bacterium]